MKNDIDEAPSSNDIGVICEADCPLCPRLAKFRIQHRTENPNWHNSPVNGFGPLSAPILLVGLAPGLKGANRTGRPFTGDGAGNLLYATLGKFGLSSGTYQARPNDGVRLTSIRIVNAVRCVPPQNKPERDEINACRTFLVQDMQAMPKLKTIITLGKIAHDSTLKALGLRRSQFPFGHAHQYTLLNGKTLISSYHCSRLNTNRGVLTPVMFEKVFKMAISSSGL